MYRPTDRATDLTVGQLYQWIQFRFSPRRNKTPKPPLIQEDPVDGDDVMQCKANYHITYRPQNDAMQCITSV
ncbi:hypothetical protein HYE67_008634 [Fusarium culmorum]|uniref:Chromosome 1, complete genome n=3 Tax=Fusarium sambucinum species complex TaxID=569360 RepID=A0A0E0RN48_GIBZE|nr:hypothetical protein FG05_30048 [Fusarium graminearum]PTD11238.1 hypothetical protein FCULG_00003334 [Fusarium culmorum]QPC66403.1 hypothetical protein HYE67_008634 [Fusarium culmorum]CAF3515415.1 unnamed protein product [Fusarium graminearum]CAF3582826.1 unnamed protein product [Fusarium graminearum]